MIYIALLRGINLAGHRQVAMADLRVTLTGIGLEDVRTVLNSGNVVFRAKKRAPGQLERLLEATTASRLGLATDYFVRTAEEWSAVIERNPFTSEATRDPSRLLVTFLKQPVPAGAIQALASANPGRERLHASGRELFIVFPDGVGRSPLSPLLTPKRLGGPCTGRNWNTVLKVAAAARSQ